MLLSGWGGAWGCRWVACVVGGMREWRFVLVRVRGVFLIIFTCGRRVPFGVLVRGCLSPFSRPFEFSLCLYDEVS